MQDVCLFVLFPTWPAKIPLRPMMTRMLKTAEPTIVPTPTSPLVMKTPEGGRHGGMDGRRGSQMCAFSICFFVWFQVRQSSLATNLQENN